MAYSVPRAEVVDVGEAGAEGRGSRLRRAAPLLLAAAAAAALLARHGRFMHDDAFIVLRYADHLIRGLGPGWNAGERVEGFTSAPWLLQVAAAGLAGAPLRFAAQGLGLAWLGAWMAALALAAPRPGAWAALLPATSLPAIAWSVAGLETASFSALLAIAVLAHLRRTEGSATMAPLAMACALLAVTRPEGVLLAAAPVLERAWARDRRASVDCAAAVLGSMALLALGRWTVYGSILPNSALAKTRPDGLAASFIVEYLRDNLAHVVVAAAALAFLLVDALARRRCAAGPARLAWIAAAAAYAVGLAAVGGDHMPHARVLVPLLAVVSALFAHGLARGKAYPVALAILVAAQLVTAALTPPVPEDGASHTGAYVGTFLQQVLPAGSLVAVNSAGATPYYAPDLRFVDMLGLNDAHIARAPAPPVVLPMQRLPGHRRGDGGYVLSRRPDAIVLGPAHGDTAPWFYSDLGIVSHPGFSRDYAPVVADLRFEALRGVAVRELPPWRGIPGEEGTTLTFFVRRGTAAEEAVRGAAGGRRR
jgi:arabinofuranosyltransferase